MNAPAKVVLDCGGGSLKAGFAGQADPVKILPNQVVNSKGDRQRYVGDEVDACRDTSALRYGVPCERGYLVNWEVQKEIFDRAFGKAILQINPAESDLLFTQPLFNPFELEEVACEVVFEDYGFCSLFSPSAAMMSVVHHKHAAMTAGKYDPLSFCGGMVLDSGYSFSHAVPYFDDSKLNYAIKRVNVGGKALTNYLKEIVSFRAWNMMEETFLMNVVKERLCYVSQNFLHDLELTKQKDNPISRQYVLPDYTTTDRGHIVDPSVETMKSDETQVLVMNNERIVVPEILFHPSDIGIDQAGVAEAAVQAVQATHPDLHPILYGNISLCGGNCLFPGYRQRVETEIRKLAPSDTEVRVTLAENPITAAWKGASIFMASPDFDRHKVTKKEYQEHGASLCHRRFSML